MPDDPTTTDPGPDLDLEDPVPADFMPRDFKVPAPLVTAHFRLEPLAVSHNAEDLAAWTSSIDHIRATPGFAGRGWPTRVFTLAENENDLRRHFDDFLLRRGFTYAVLDAATRSYVGCVYLYPSRADDHDVDVRSWVRVTRAADDKPLHDAILAWIRSSWPWKAPDYTAR